MKKAIITLSILCAGILMINPLENITFAQGNNEVIIENVGREDQSVEIITILNKEQAKEILEIKNPDMEYSYQGDESTFEVLNQKGLSGYVFLPNVDSDLGYFVDKNTSDVYYFHPSGYLDLMI